MKTPLKSLIALICFFFCVALLIPTTSFAEDDPGGGGGGITPTEEYNLLAPLPGMESVPASESLLGAYFSNIYQLGVSLVILLAVAVLIFGGIQYMMTDSFTKKGEARDTITAAIVGILLAVCSYAILTLLIGDRAISFDMNIENVTPREWVETPGPEECEISQTAAQLCLSYTTPSSPSFVVEDDQCQGARGSGAVCCYYGLTGVNTYVSPTYTGACSASELESSRPVNPGASPEQRASSCLTESTKQLPRQARVDHCEYYGENIDGYISFDEIKSKASGDQGSACFGLSNDVIEGFLRDFYNECADKGGEAVDETIDGVSALFCFINTVGICEDEIPEAAESPISSPFGPARFCMNSDYGSDFGGRNTSYSNHTGIDFMAPGGTPLYPVMDGEVVLVRPDSGRDGHNVRIRHTLPNGQVFYTQYSHLQRGGTTVKEGDLVTKSESFAKSDNTGTSTGFHLHLMFFDGSGKIVDPLNYFESWGEMVDILSGGAGSC